nr:immunoglobulin heavy chain junction region [Mus musculus]MBK4196991.1 immunoglobulin heavy chain junction region [Mus musculus]MBK4196992.1 immunoglobulin heavy chain junction region [Mus musculus]MBK4196993.1 immunoglobulin heavy chain junction region [Mus musculus]MBK4196994.1 immunoglobulin heavy chain junction region [Mus musculus]
CARLIYYYGSSYFDYW